MTDIRYDLHTHSTFSDGSELTAMVAAAADAGLDGVGVSDHCILVEDEFGRREHYDLVETYRERRTAIEAVRDDADVRVFDAVELSYVEGTEAEIRSFLEEAAFDYTIGSVHFAGPWNYTVDAQHADAGRETRVEAVDRYFEAQVAMVESGLFDVAGHIDLVQRLPALRGLPEERHYERLAEAFAGSSTVPEINAGRATESYGEVHPEPRFIEYLRERGVEFTLGTDSHTPAELRDRVAHLRERGLAPDGYPV